MTYLNRLSFIIVALFLLWVPSHLFAERLYSIEESLPSNVVISGVVHPGDGTTYNGAYDAVLEFYNQDRSSPTISVQQKVQFHQNYFRLSLDLTPMLYPMFRYRKKMFVKLSIGDDVDITLPFASVPMTIKSGLATTTNLMMDDDVFSIDYEKQRIGIGTAVPSSMVHVVGTVNASTYFAGDGSQLTNLKHGGGDNYNFLKSDNGEFIVITVNATGKVMVGGRLGIDIPKADLQVFGSLLVEPNESVSSNIISGAGTRWMWYADRSVLRIGYTPSIYWDDEYSGDHSIAFGYASIAQGDSSIVGGGYYNVAKSDNSIITGGSDNLVTAQDGIILGGQKNYINETSSIILGGLDNAASKDAIVLGGFDNASYGRRSVVSGYRNLLSGDQSLILGGKNNNGFSESSILIGSNITAVKDHDRAVVFNASSQLIESVASSHIKIYAPNGVGIGTNLTSPNALSVAGAVSANMLYGDGSQIANLKNPQSAWTPHPLKPDLLIYPHRLGVLTSSLLESINVSGSIHLSGEAHSDAGTIRYIDDEFSVYKDGLGWVSLQMVDTDTTYNAIESMILDEPNLTFYIVTENAIIGQVKKWNGNYWDHDFIDQFVEQPELSRFNDVTLPKRLFLATGNVAINVTDNVTDSNPFNVPFTVLTDDNETTALYLYADDDGVEKKISVSVDPPGLHFQSYYDGAVFKQTDQDGGGIYVGDDGLSFYVDDATGTAKNGLIISSSNITVMGTPLSDNTYPFYVGGDLGTESLLFRTDADGVGVVLRDPFFRGLEDDSVLLSQKNNGELFIQSADQGGDIIFRNADRQLAILRSTYSGKSLFGLTSGALRSGLDVSQGHVHISDGYGFHFYHHSTKKSGVTFDSTKPQRIQFNSSSEFDRPNMIVSNLGNVGVNGMYDDSHDLIVKDVTDRDAIVQLDSIDGKNPGIILRSDGVAGMADDGDFLDDGESYSFQMSGDRVNLSEGSSPPALTIDQDGYVGLYDESPTGALSIGADTVMLNQTGIYMKDADGSSVPFIDLDGDQVNMKASDQMNFVDAHGEMALSITGDGVAVNRNKLLTEINSQSIGLEVSGSVMVNGDIYNSIGDQIFPLDVQNVDQSKSERTINTIHIDTASGLTLEGDNTSSKLKVKGAGYYNRIKLPNGQILSATKNMDLRLIGRGVTVTANNQHERGTVTMNDSLKLLNDLVSGGEIKGDLNVKGNFRVINDKIYGNAAGIRNIPFHWQHVTRNNTTISDPSNVNLDIYSDEGEIYYLDGNIGINTDSPSELLEVVGTSSVDELIISEKLLVSDIESTGNIHLNSKAQLLFKSNYGNVVFGRNDRDSTASNFKEFMRFTKDSQWLIGTSSSPYLVDLGQNNSTANTEFRIEFDQGSNIDFKRRTSDVSMSIRHDDTGTRFSTPFSHPNVQIDSSTGFGFYTNDSTKSMVMNDQGYVGVFTNSPRNSLDINGAMAIGYDFVAPSNGLIVKNKVGVGMDAANLPLYPLEVSGSVIVGSPLSSGLSSGFYINGDGSYKLFIGGDPIGNEKVFFNNHLSIKDGSLSIRQGKDPGVEIIRDNTTGKVDQWNQLEANKGLNINSTKDMAFQTYSGSSWQDELVIDSSGRLGIGTVPSEVIHVLDDDNDVSVKIKSAGDSSIHLKYSGYQGMIGTNSKGFHIKTQSSSFANPELTIVQNKVGINKESPDSAYKVDVGGTVNASDYFIKDEFTSNGFRAFQSVPTGIVIVWLDTSIPPGWQECNGSNGCPNMAGRYVKGSNIYNNNISTYGGTNSGVLSSTTHGHTNASHLHKLTSPGHTHSVDVDSTRVHGKTKKSNAYVDPSGKDTSGNDFTLFNSVGNHDHNIDYTHGHSGITFSGGEHGANHKNSDTDTHGHGGSNSSNSDTKTVGTGSNALGKNGDHHQHTFDNRPGSRFVRFIVKVNE
ncbi:hypothetical protein DID73_00075 [Candidatus Marinamargulisbacteria bacterium SCGC AG-343-K17]|nr:hypothetical protein DID73_00075 [Candidatus Marinamargulisbacteria bacterium SCGC AG-343-K17]